MAKFEYICSKGHGNGAPYELKKCQVFLKGKPCTGKLKPIGKGSRTFNKPKPAPEAVPA